MRRQYIRNDECEATQLNDEWLILNTNNFTVTKVNEVGGFCWNLLSEIQTISDLAYAVEKHFDGAGSNEKVRQELSEFMNELLKCELIHLVS
ncbi:PqqD family protein [Falsibacillus albus]|uniref:PqqD family protein n=1 Tax=Falsibacillus albus TaxID=2478915 RepID=A0A3L7K6E5_9BACI|nr:PqqD family protein [Falsibacillus albus]RLQ96272.1 PqqD family protein [Falsibacillus albus]